MVSDSELTDRYNRRLNYLRISVTDRCNLRCIYCMPRDFIPKLLHHEILTYEEMLRLVRVGTGLGISKVRITGGEPLVRKDIYDFLNALSAFGKLDDISLTTNGVLLKDNIEKIHAAGIRRINISLDTLKPEKFEKITRHDYFSQVYDGIMLAHEAGFDPIKINVVAIRGVNDDELEDLARLSFSYPFHIRFIEYMPVGNPGNFNQFFDTKKERRIILAPEILTRISRLGNLMPVENSENIYGPAERYRFESAIGEIGIIRPLSHHFCHKCNRLRLTASGQLRVCLLSDIQEDMKGPLRSGCSDKELAEIFLKAVQSKPLRHNLAFDTDNNTDKNKNRVMTQMSAIGG